MKVILATHDFAETRYFVKVDISHPDETKEQTKIGDFVQKTKQSIHKSFHWRYDFHLLKKTKGHMIN